MMEKLDSNTKQLLRGRRVLGWILCKSVSEFKDVDIETAMSCIEGEPTVSEIAVAPRWINLDAPEAIIGMPTEDNVPKEEIAYFDVRFFARTPDGQHLKIIVDVEGKNEYDPADINLMPSCNDIKKVYSIWVCMDAPPSMQNTITEYDLARTDIYGHADCPCYDFSTILIGLNKDARQGEGSELHQLLSTLFSSKLMPEEKETILKEQFQFPPSADS